MFLDLLIVIITGFFVIKGIKHGGVRQIINLVGVMLGVILATKFYIYLGRVISSINIFGPFISELVSWIIIYFAIYIVINIVGGLIKQEIEDTFIIGGVDKILGGVIGGLKTFIIIIFIIFLLDILIHSSPGKKDKLAKIRDIIDNSALSSTIVKYSPFKKLEITKAFSNYAQIQNSPQALKKLSQQEDVKKLLENEKIQSLLKDEKLNEAIANKDYTKLFQNENILEITRDRELIKLLLSVNFDNVLEDEDIQ